MSVLESFIASKYPFWYGDLGAELVFISNVSAHQLISLSFLQELGNYAYANGARSFGVLPTSCEPFRVNHSKATLRGLLGIFPHVSVVVPVGVKGYEAWYEESPGRLLDRECTRSEHCQGRFLHICPVPSLRKLQLQPSRAGLPVRNLLSLVRS